MQCRRRFAVGCVAKRKVHFKFVPRDVRDARHEDKQKPVGSRRSGEGGGAQSSVLLQSKHINVYIGWQYTTMLWYAHIWPWPCPLFCRMQCVIDLCLVYNVHRLGPVRACLFVCSRRRHTCEHNSGTGPTPTGVGFGEPDD